MLGRTSEPGGGAPAEAPARFDTLISGGRVIDPGSGRDGCLDVAIAGGRIAAVAEDIPAEQAADVVDASGCVVVPGLVDLHTHVFWGGTYWGVDPNSLAWRGGVTTWIDAGSAGAFTLAAFRQLCIEPSRVRIKALLNISTIGLVAETGELLRRELCDPGLCADLIRCHRDFVVGVKCRIDARTVGDRGVEPLVAALEAAEATGVPVMVHIGAGPPKIDQILDRLRTGDILTHCATGHSMALIDEQGRLRPTARRALARGVLMDVGHGSGAFSFRTAEALLAQGAPPDIISSDIHQQSIRGPMFDLATCLSKFLALGMSLEDVIRAATARPAQALGLTDLAGSLAVGQPADVGVFVIEEGDFSLYDVELQRRPADRLLVNRLTMVNGRALPPQAPAPVPPWIGRSAHERAYEDALTEGWRRPRAAAFDSPDHPLATGPSVSKADGAEPDAVPGER